MATPPLSDEQLVEQDRAHDLNLETDARFWSATNYRVGQKLDPKNPTDRAMIKVWMDIFAKVKAEDTSGRLVRTHDLPEVRRHLQDAAVANAAAVAHVKAASAATDPGAAREHVKAASVASSVGKQSAARAAEHQPPTASPAVAQAAATEAHHAAQQPPPDVVVLPVGHPAHHHPHAQPSHPDLATVTPSIAEPPQTAEDHLALEQAGAAPSAAADTFRPKSKAQIDATTKKVVLVAGGIAGAFVLGALVVRVFGGSWARR